MVKAETGEDWNGRGYYPRLMKSMNDSTIVLFSKEETGFVVGGSDYPLGFYSENWSAGSFRDYRGYVTLSNED